jgi:hypothetical protein
MPKSYDVTNFRMSPKFQENNELRQSMKGSMGRDVTLESALRKRITLPHISIQQKEFIDGNKNTVPVSKSQR